MVLVSDGYRLHEPERLCGVLREAGFELLDPVRLEPVLAEQVADTTRVAAEVDIPMGEFWTDKVYVGSLKVASSAAHLHGRRLVAAEAFTAGPPNGKWRNHPGSLKRIGDGTRFETTPWILGRLSTNVIVSGLAMGPSSWPT